MSKKSRLKKLAARLGKLEQVAALPYRMGEQGLEFLVITSRRTKRLIVPKGWPMPGKHDAAAAAIEADEEAGVKGRIDPRPFGSFEYLKEVGSKPIPVEAASFPLGSRRSNRRGRNANNASENGFRPRRQPQDWMTAGSACW